MKTLLTKARREAARRLIEAPMTVAPARGLLSISFDDVPATAWTEGGAVLAAHGVKATYYVSGGLCGGRNLDLPQFTEAHLQEIHAAGHEVGCHSFDHVSALACTPAAFEESLERNARWVGERLAGCRLESFAFPYGDVAIGAKRVVARRFTTGRDVRVGLNVGVVDRTRLTVFPLEAAKLPHLDMEAAVAEAARRRGWIVGFGHDVSDRPTPVGCTQRDLDRLITLARAAGLDVVPVREAARAAGGARQADARAA